MNKTKLACLSLLLITFKVSADPTIYSGPVLGDTFEMLSDGMTNEMKLKFQKIREDQQGQMKEFDKLTPEQRRKRYENDYKTLTEDDKELLKIVKDNKYKEFENRSFDCAIPDNLKGEIFFKEDISIAHNFEKRSQVFDNYKHIITSRESELNSKYKMFDVETSDQTDNYNIVGCKKKRDFELSARYLIFQSNKYKHVYMLEHEKFDNMKTEINNDYSKFLKSVESRDYLAVTELLKKIDFSLVERNVIKILVKNNDEKIIDILKEANLLNAESIIQELSFTKNENLYLKIYPFLEKNRRPLFFADAFTRGYSVKVLDLYKDLKKNNIAKEHFLRLIFKGCSSINSKELLNIIANKGFNFKETNEEGQNALHYIAQFGNTEYDEKCIDYLLSIGLDINGIDNNGDTPLHKASSVYSKKMIAYLISKGALTNILNKNGKLPIK